MRPCPLCYLWEPVRLLELVGQTIRRDFQGKAFRCIECKYEWVDIHDPDLVIGSLKQKLKVEINPEYLKQQLDSGCVDYGCADRTHRETITVKTGSTEPWWGTYEELPFTIDLPKNKKKKKR